MRITRMRTRRVLTDDGEELDEDIHKYLPRKDMGRFRSNSTNLTPIKYIALSDIYLNLILRADGYLSDSTPSELISCWHFT